MNPHVSPMDPAQGMAAESCGQDEGSSGEACARAVSATEEKEGMERVSSSRGSTKVRRTGRRRGASHCSRGSRAACGGPMPGQAKCVRNHHVPNGPAGGCSEGVKLN